MSLLQLLELLLKAFVICVGVFVIVLILFCVVYSIKYMYEVIKDDRKTKKVCCKARKRRANKHNTKKED